MFNIDEFTGDYKTQFPEFILDFNVPDSFKDISCDCDATPSWANLELCLMFFADFTNPKLSESGCAIPRFYLAKYQHKNDFFGGEPIWEFESNDIEAIYYKINEINKEGLNTP